MPPRCRAGARIAAWPTGPSPCAQIRPGAVVRCSVRNPCCRLSGLHLDDALAAEPAQFVIRKPQSDQHFARVLAERRRRAKIDLPAAIASDGPMYGTNGASRRVLELVEQVEVAHLRILVELVQAALGRERHIVLRQALEPLFARSGREDRSQLAADGLIAVDTAFAVGIALQQIRRLDDRGEAFPEFVRR